MITDYSSLKTSIADFIHRNDLNDKIPLFIQLAEAKIAKNIKSRKLSADVTKITTGGVDYIDVPSDYSMLNQLVIKTNPTYVLELVPDHVLSQYNQNSITGIPKFYSISGDKIKLAPIPDGTYNIDINYDAQLTQLSSINPTNFILDNYPYLYLYGALIETCIYTNDPDQVQFYQQKMSEAIEEIWKNYNDETFSGSVLRARSDYVVDF